MTEREEHIRTLCIIFYVMAPLSMLSGLFIMGSFLKFPGQLFTTKANHLQFVFFQSLCDFMYSSKFLLTAIFIKSSWISYGTIPFIPIESPNNTVPSTGPDTLCIGLGIMGSFFNMASVMWNLMVSVQILTLFWIQPYEYSSIVNHKENYTFFYHILVWVFALSTAIVPAFFNQYGPTTNGCWIEEKYLITRLLTFVFPLILFILTSLVILLITLSKVKLISLRIVYVQNFGTKMESSQFPNLRLLVSYTIVFIAFWSCPVVLRMLELVHKQPELLVYGDIISISSQGLANAVVWGTSSYVRDLFTKKR